MKWLGLFVLGMLPCLVLGCTDPVEEADALYGPEGPPKPQLVREIEASPFVDVPAMAETPPAENANGAPRQTSPKAPAKATNPDGSPVIRIAQKNRLTTAQRIGAKQTSPPSIALDLSKIKKPEAATPEKPAEAPRAGETLPEKPDEKPADKPVVETAAASAPAEPPAETAAAPEAPAVAATTPEAPAEDPDVSPAGSATSDSKEEAEEVGPWVGTGSTRLSVVKEGDFPLPPAAGKFSLKASAGKSATAVLKTKKDGLSLEARARYEISFKVFSRIDPYTCVVKLVDDKKNATPAMDKSSKAEQWDLAPDKWNSVEAVVEIPEGKDVTQTLQFEFTGVPKSSWYVDDVRVLKANK